MERNDSEIGLKPSRFSQQFKEALTAWISHVMPWLGIPQWEINLLDAQPESENAAASILCTHGRDIAALCLSSDFFDFPSHSQQHYLMHELSHIVLDRLDKVAGFSALDKLLGAAAFEVFYANHKTALEKTTDSLACVFIEFFKDGELYNQLWDKVMEAERVATGTPAPPKTRQRKNA